MRGGSSAGGTANARIRLRRLSGPSTTPGPRRLSGRWMVLAALPRLCLLHVARHEAGDGFVDQANGAIDVGVRDLQGRTEILNVVVDHIVKLAELPDILRLTREEIAAVEAGTASTPLRSPTVPCRTLKRPCGPPWRNSRSTRFCYESSSRGLVLGPTFRISPSHWCPCTGAAILIRYSQLDRLHDGTEPSLPPPRTESR